MASFHPSENTLVEFSAGSLSSPISMCVSAHIDHCPSCRNKLNKFNSIGGAILDETESAQVGSACFDSLMERINAHGVMSPAIKVDDIGACEISNKKRSNVIEKLRAQNHPLEWKKVTSHLSESVLTTGQNAYEVCFHKIRRGGKVAEHDHGGMEVTVVLEGSFSDENGTYKIGDYIEKHPGDIHKPMATQDQDCLCLSVIEAPVKLTGLLGKVVNPFLSFRPR